MCDPISRPEECSGMFILSPQEYAVHIQYATRNSTVGRQNGIKVHCKPRDIMEISNNTDDYHFRVLKIGSRIAVNLVRPGFATFAMSEQLALRPIVLSVTLRQASVTGYRITHSFRARARQT